jgi:hypothetical protein
VTPAELIVAAWFVGCVLAWCLNHVNRIAHEEIAKELRAHDHRLRRLEIAELDRSEREEGDGADDD